MATLRSRLARKEVSRIRRRMLLFGGLTIFTLLFLLFWGIPLLVKVATFLTEWQGSRSPVEVSDQLPPAPPSLNPLPKATNKEFLSLSGSAEAGASVEVFLNSTSFQKVVVTNDGTFVADQIPLIEGENKIYVQTIDEAGNLSQPSPIKIILFDNQPPTLEISSPQNGANFNGDGQKKVTVAGKTEADINLTINDRFVILDQEGNFTTQLTLQEGENIIKVSAVDLAENKTEKEIKVNFSP